MSILPLGGKMNMVKIFMENFCSECSLDGHGQSLCFKCFYFLKMAKFHNEDFNMKPLGSVCKKNSTIYISF